MKIQYCSDLHLELNDNSLFLKENQIIPMADILILAGDITYLRQDFYKHPFFDYISANWKQVYWVPGNHEFYCGIDVNSYDFSKPIKIRENINLVNNYSVKINDIQFIFSCLWSNIDEKYEKLVESMVSDFECIIIDGKKLSSKTFNQLHKQSLNYLKQELEQSNSSKKIIVTHHLPSHECNHIDYINSKINSAFVTDLTNFVEKSNADAWIYGHSHRNKPDFKIGKTQMLTNQLGYISHNEHKSFSLDNVIEL